MTMHMNLVFKRRGRSLRSALAVSLILLVIPVAALAQEGFAADLTDDQINRIQKATDEFHARQFDLLNTIQVKYQALLMELQRRDAFKDKKTAAASSAKYKRLVRELGDLVGQLLRARTDYLLAIKDVLTPEQKKELIYSMDFDVEPEKRIRIYYDVDMDELLGGFTPEQTKQLLKIRHAYEVRMAELTLAVDNLEVDMRQEYMRAEPDSKKMRGYLQEATDLNIQILNAAVEFTLQVKDVLTDEQKQRLRHFFLTVYQPDILREN